MANLKSSKKDVRRIRRRSEHNRRIKSRLKTLRKRADSSVFEGEENAEEVASRFISALDKAAKTKILHKNKARRLKSRMDRLLNSSYEDEPEQAKRAPAAAEEAPAEDSAAKGDEN